LPKIDVLPINLIESLLVLIVTLIAALLLYVWSFGLWLIRLTTFCRAFELMNVRALSIPLSQARILQDFRDCRSDVDSRKGFLAKFYFFISLYMIVPICLFMICFSLKLAIMFPTLIAGLQLKFPTWLDYTATAVAVVLGIVLSVFSMTSVVVSANSVMKVEAASMQAIILTIKYFLQIALISGVMVFFLAIVSEPQLLTSFPPKISIDVLKSNIWSEMLENLWQGLVSIVMMPLLFAPVCELLRGKVK
jgi:hypothetical protein